MPLIPVSFLRDCHTFVILQSLEQLRSDRKNVSLCFYKTFSLPFPSSLLKLPFKKRRRLLQRQRQKAVILLVKRTKMIVRHVRHAFFNNSLPYSSKLLREMTKFKVLTATWTNYSESFSLTLYFKSVRTNPVIGHFAHIE